MLKQCPTLSLTCTTYINEFKHCRQSSLGPGKWIRHNLGVVGCGLPIASPGYTPEHTGNMCVWYSFIHVVRSEDKVPWT